MSRHRADLNGPAHLSYLEAGRVHAFVDHLLTVLRMSNYTVQLMADPPHADDAIASMTTIDGRAAGKLRLCEDWEERPLEERYDTLIHEVVHLMHRGPDDMARAVADDGHLTTWRYFDPYWSRYCREMELFVDHLAGVLGQLPSVRQKWEELNRWVVMQRAGGPA